MFIRCQLFDGASFESDTLSRIYFGRDALLGSYYLGYEVDFQKVW
jgi:hypothetical protein